MIKNNSIFACFTFLSLVFCFHAMAQNNPDELKGNILLSLDKKDHSHLNWMNKPEKFSVTNGQLKIEALKGTDFFNDPESGESTSSAPFLFKELEGDFVAVLKLRPDFSSQWNAGAIFMMIDESNWIKFAFENSDATGKSIVSVVTRDVSDDANGVILNDHDELWLKMIRKGNIYAMHWSLDGTEYKMCRLAAMNGADKVKIGLEAQCPVGKKALHDFLYFGIESKTVKDLRKGE
ncbi:DUF1349 domain-containing protein [Lutimonas zeaxanthinifaciens]|uniref:DUF1349 domain-containing protein n=1 Tax=Lutimonas zeaxanthinifaciens TaxID=3060215 RepID=UPI00265CEB24|nr:DUF1349 domain-containing protein [Lutimonas sp. YSD2104]WKK66255.1 DUF1349 domain-containing protein [Lutimonas sp. YSD2104]